MWWLLFILPIFPLFFYFQENVLELFPALSKYFPEKAPVTVVSQGIGHDEALQFALGEPGKWYSLRSDEGLVAWMVDYQGNYRLAVGCAAGQPASLQLTKIAKYEVPASLVVNYEYGTIDLTQGYSQPPDLVAAVSQFKNIHLVLPDETVLGQFTVPGHESNSIARALQQDCI